MGVKYLRKKFETKKSRLNVIYKIVINEVDVGGMKHDVDTD